MISRCGASSIACAARMIALDLHLVDLGIEDPEPAAARAEHRVLLVDLAPSRQQRLELARSSVRSIRARSTCAAQVRQVGQELVQRRVEQADRHRQPLHRLEQALEVLLLQRQQVARARSRRSSSSSAMIIVRILGWRSSAMNMCSVRHRPMPSAPSSRACGASSGVVGVGAHAEPAELVGPPSTVSKLAPTTSGVDQRDVVVRDSPVVPLMAMKSPSASSLPVERAAACGLEVDVQLGGAGDGGAAHAAGDQRRVRGLAALAGEDALGRVEAGDVVGLGERAHEDDVAPLGRGRRPRRRR